MSHFHKYRIQIPLVFQFPVVLKLTLCQQLSPKLFEMITTKVISCTVMVYFMHQDSTSSAFFSLMLMEIYLIYFHHNDPINLHGRQASNNQKKKRKSTYHTNVCAISEKVDSITWYFYTESISVTKKRREFETHLVYSTSGCVTSSIWIWYVTNLGHHPIMKAYLRFNKRLVAELFGFPISPAPPLPTLCQK